MNPLDNSIKPGLQAIKDPRPADDGPRTISAQSENGVPALYPDGLDTPQHRPQSGPDAYQSGHSYPDPPAECPLCGQSIRKWAYESTYRMRRFPWGVGPRAANADHVLLDEISLSPGSNLEFNIKGGDALHSRCLAAWPQKADFLAAWNTALSAEWPGKALLDKGSAGFGYTPPEQWSASVFRLQEEAQRLEEWQRREAARLTRLGHLEIKKDQCRAIILAAGLCSPEEIDAYIYDMNIEDFRLHLAGTGLSRVDFRPDQHRSPHQRFMATLSPATREMWGFPEYNPDFPDQ